MVHLDSESIDQCMEAARNAILLDPELQGELQASRSDFFPGEPGLAPSAERERPSERRHLEWFLAESPRVQARKPRMAALLAQCAVESGVDPTEWAAALDGSRASLFEVTAVEPGRGLTLLDLAGQFTCSALAAEGSGDLAVGDVIAGRIFPIGERIHSVSSAASIWRSPVLLSAVRADLAHARAGRSPVVRGRSELLQSEIEAILHAWTKEAFGGRTVASGAVERARTLFLENGLSLEDADELLEMLAREAPDPTRILPGGGDVLGDVLTSLAFETRVDLETARTVLIDAWDELHARPPEPVAPSSEVRGAQVRDAIGAPLDVAAAIAEFDRKRRAGASLDQALTDLERDLDLDPSESSDELDEEDETAPELPGVVGGVVEEFLWDEGRVHGEDRALRYRSLRGLGRSAGEVSVFEALGQRELTEFACRWAIEAGDLRDPADAQLLVEGLDRFCAWVEENHDLPLHTAFAPVLTGLQESLPRVALANRACEIAVAQSDLEWLELVERRGTREAVVRDLEGRPRSVELSPSILQHLRPGDWLRGRGAAGEGLEVGACYPAALRQALLT